MSPRPVSTKELDRMIDEGEDLSDVLIPAVDHPQFSAASAGVSESIAGSKPIKLDLPIWLLIELDKEARRRNVPRKALINMWLADRVDSAKKVVGS